MSRVKFKQHSGKLMTGSRREVWYPMDQVFLDEKFIGFLYRKTGHFSFHVSSLSDEDKDIVKAEVQKRSETDVYTSQRPTEAEEAVIQFTQSPTLDSDFGDEE